MTDEVKNIASAFPLWIIAFIVVSIVIVQSLIFIRIAMKAAPKVGMTSNETKTSIRTGLISSIGPSFAIAIVIISLISLIGSPLTLMRIGIIGSAQTEAGAVQVGANAFGVDVGSKAFTAKAFATVVWTMCVGGMGWLFFTLFFTKSLGKIRGRLAKKNPKVMSIFTSAAMMGAFGYLASEQMVVSISYAIAGVIAIIVNFLLQWISKKTGVNWFKEWALGIAMVFGMFGGYVSTLV